MTLVKQLCENGYIPVISSVAASTEGETLNLNADYVATGVAGALDALKLIFLTDVDGVMTGGNLLQIIELAESLKNY